MTGWGWFVGWADGAQVRIIAFGVFIASVSRFGIFRFQFFEFLVVVFLGGGIVLLFVDHWVPPPEAIQSVGGRGVHIRIRLTISICFWKPAISKRFCIRSSVTFLEMGEQVQGR